MSNCRDLVYRRYMGGKMGQIWGSYKMRFPLVSPLKSNKK
jgi:hypothetical protein